MESSPSKSPLVLEPTGVAISVCCILSSLHAFFTHIRDNRKAELTMCPGLKLFCVIIYSMYKYNRDIVIHQDILNIKIQSKLVRFPLSSFTGDYDIIFFLLR